jgi:hypothetical protein
VKLFIADVLPEITVPIRIPTTSVNAIANPAIHFLCRFDAATFPCSVIVPCSYFVRSRFPTGAHP